jgi:DNA-cytosine methyltransferase
VNVLSLFDGMSCGMLALDRLGIKVDKYYASEIDKYAIQVSQANYPDIVQLGDVTNWQEWDIDWATIDLVTGGFPCQSWSLAGKQLGDKDERGMLFWVMLDIMQKVMENNPNAYYLMENVKMKKEFEEYITMHTQNALPNVYKYFINSSLVSAQSRQRYYWTNIPNVEQPKERGIVLKDILEDGFNTERDKSHCLDANYYKGSSVENYFKKSRRQMVFKDSGNNGMILVPQKLVDDTNDLPEKSQTIKSQYYKSSKANFERSGTFHATGIPQKLVDVRAMTEVRTPEANQIRYEHKRKTGKDWSPRHMRHLVERQDEKMNTLTSALTKQHILQITEEQEVYWRKLTPIECERLQTVPDNYTNHVSNTQRYKMLGNGWTIEVIAHILKGMEV